MVKLPTRKDDKGWQKVSVRVAVWRKLRLLAAQRDMSLGDLIADLVGEEEVDLSAEQGPTE